MVQSSDHMEVWKRELITGLYAGEWIVLILTVSKENQLSSSSRKALTIPKGQCYLTPSLLLRR
uniref:Alternative protein TMTC3 n=1 Tax=Homo sapiens TaxID=9606 RepID=L8ECP4_HUMAN|nr:alternative protein TMTC3 [Homo sapiens]